MKVALILLTTCWNLTPVFVKVACQIQQTSVGWPRNTRHAQSISKITSFTVILTTAADFRSRENSLKRRKKQCVAGISVDLVFPPTDTSHGESCSVDEHLLGPSSINARFPPNPILFTQPGSKLHRFKCTCGTRKSRFFTRVPAIMMRFDIRQTNLEINMWGGDKKRRKRSLISGRWSR